MRSEHRSGQITIQMAKLLLDGFVDLAYARTLLLDTARNCCLAFLRCVQGLSPKVYLS
jgi:hypothetical protein